IPDATSIIEKVFAQNPDQLFWRQWMYLLSFFENDEKRMAEQVSWAMHKAGAEDHLLAMDAATNAYFGRLDRARALSQEAVEYARRNQLPERAALQLATEAVWEAWIGSADAATHQAQAALSAVPGREVRALAALALARAGDVGQAAKLANDLEGESA